MADIVPNVNDPNFKSLLSKLMLAGWTERQIEIDKKENALRHFELQFTAKGTACCSAIKHQTKISPIWTEAVSFLASLNEQEEAFFYECVLSDAPPILPL